MKTLALTIAPLLMAFATSVSAQQGPVPYGEAVSLEQAQRIAAAAEEAARARGHTMAFAIVDPTGELILFHRMDDTPYASSVVAQEKARTAARFKRTTKSFFDAIAGGRTPTLSVPGVLAIEGGTPIIMDGRLIGALGVSGGTAEQDGEVATAALSQQL